MQKDGGRLIDRLNANEVGALKNNVISSEK